MTGSHGGKRREKAPSQPSPSHGLDPHVPHLAWSFQGHRGGHWGPEVTVLRSFSWRRRHAPEIVNDMSSKQMSTGH